MPSKSAKQARFMRACAKNPGKMKKKCPPKEVAEEFVRADRRAQKGKSSKGKMHKGKRKK